MVYLPIIERRKEPRAKAEEPIPTGSERILFVDDEPVLANMGQQILESLGYDVDIRTGSIEALELFKAQPDRFDLIITDIIMPEKEGIEVIMELKKDFPDVKIIAISGGGQIDAEEYLHMAKMLGAKFTFIKPFERQELLDAVKEMVR